VATGAEHNAREVAQIALVDQFERCLLNVYVAPPPGAVVASYLTPLTGKEGLIGNKAAPLAILFYHTRPTQATHPTQTTHPSPLCYHPLSSLLLLKPSHPFTPPGIHAAGQGRMGNINNLKKM
jgi:hypothetical protein